MSKTKKLLKFDVLNRFTGAVQFTAEIDCRPDEMPSVKLWRDVAEDKKNTLEQSYAQILFLRQALERIVANRDNKNWRKPEIIAEAEQALRFQQFGLKQNQTVETKPAPYPFCRTPSKCAGKGYCPHDIACND